MNTECQICSEKMNKTTRFPIRCQCDETCCRACVKKYITSKQNEEIHCMFCKNPWSRLFLTENIDKSYISKDYLKHRENILFEREVGMLPATQPYVERNIKIEEITKKNEELQEKISLLHSEMRQNQSDIHKLRNNSDVERRKYVRKCPKNECQGFLSSQLKCEICSSWVCSECREIKGTDRDAPHTCVPEILESVKLLNTDTKACPSCSTMIHKIEGCNQMFCTECHSAFNWVTLRIETGAIHNPHYFEWQRRNTNAAVAPRNPNDVLCGRELDRNFLGVLRNKFEAEYDQNPASISNKELKRVITAIIADAEGILPHIKTRFIEDMNRGATSTYSREDRKFNYAHLVFANINNNHRSSESKIINDTIAANSQLQYFVETFSRYTLLEKVIQRTIHIHAYEMRRWDNADRLTNNLELRIKYMRNQITVEDFKTNIQRRDKETQRNTEYTNILRMYVSCMTDLLYRLNADISEYTAIITEMHGLRTYTNECIKRTFSVYASTMKHNINETFEYVTK